MLANLIVACSAGWSRQDETFVQTYVQILIIREQYPDTMKANPRIQKVLASQGFTEQTFAVQYERYARDPNEFRTLLDSARARVKSIGEQEQRQRTSKHTGSLLQSN
jgi:hypothetical protein